MENPYAYMENASNLEEQKKIKETIISNKRKQQDTNLYLLFNNNITISQNKQKKIKKSKIINLDIPPHITSHKRKISCI